MGVRFGDCRFDPEHWELRRDGELVPLEPRAMQLLHELIERGDRVATKADLLEAVWGDQFVSESALTTQVKALRRAVGDNGREQNIIKTVHGRGYRFVADVDHDVGADGDTDVAPDADRDVAANPVVAVLPFVNLSGDGGLDHIADGLTSDIVTALSKHRWLRVLPRATAAGFSGGTDAVERLRDEIGVDYAVEGTVRLGDGRFRVNASLTDAAEGTCRWAERYDRQFEDLFDVLDDITDVIVATIEPEVGYAERDRARHRPRADLRAWDLYHLGIAYFYRFTAEDNREAQRLLDEARRLDPGFADAHAWWGYAVVLGMTYWETEPDDATLREALQATTEALAVDDHNAVFHMLRGRVQLARCDYAAALAENQRAVELNPTLAAGYCGLGDSLCYEGRYDEAIEQFTRSVELGSHDPQRWAFLSYGALALLFSGRYEEAIAWTEQAAVIPNCQYWTTAHRVVALAHLGRADACERAVATLLGECPDFTIDHARRKLFYLKRRDQLDCYLDGLRVAGVPES